MHARRNGPQILDFGVSGALWRDAMVMFDRQSGSYWSHVTGKCIEGMLRGSQLERIEAVLMPFAEWARAHPESRVVVREPGMQGASRYQSYVESTRLGIFGAQAKRAELAPKAIVQGIAVGGEAAAVSHEALRARTTLEFDLGGKRFLARYERGAVTVWERRRVGKGKDAPERLVAWPTTTAFWFAWTNFYPRSDVIR